MIAYHCNYNAILQAPFQTKKDTHHISAYSSIMKCLKSRGHSVDLQILNNESSDDYRLVIEEEWQVNFQLFPPDVHCRNAAKRAIQTFKARFIYVLAGVEPTFPKFLWDILLDQTKLTLNLIHQATLYPSISAWEYFNVPHSYNATQLGPLGCKVIIPNKPNTRKSWDFWACDGFNIGPSFYHYR